MWPAFRARARCRAWPALPGEVSARWIGVTADVTRPEALAAAFAKLADGGWCLNGLVNNAGIHLDAPGRDAPGAVAAGDGDQCDLGGVCACQAAYPHLVAAGGGMIVNIGSFFDKIGVKRNLAYCATKAAVGAITRCLAVEWAAKGIRVLDVAPGYIVTDLNADVMAPGGPLRDLPRQAHSRQGTRHRQATSARLVAALFTADSAFLTGETIYIDGGQGIAH